MTTLESKVSKYAKANNITKNGTEWHIMQNAVETAIEKVEKQNFLDMYQYHNILDEVTEGINNPENWAVRSCISEDLKLLGWDFVSNGIYKA